ncbi:hypothetical protein CAMGR0001_0719 [Campylobacter gracilis RM3268]|uniref:Uncharacterized protein n=1 Tax=Campylobacter gracilis RM3268 TaxID=553220 RepID=C8PFS7_9BACT|nr:hypothetical protein CAMGR0001_0719 [Campylobacter gracilis RM3268]
MKFRADLGVAHKITLKFNEKIGAICSQNFRKDSYDFSFKLR